MALKRASAWRRKLRVSFGLDKQCRVFRQFTFMKTTIALLVSISLWLTGFEAKAVSPPPDGGYPNGNTAEGQNALLGVTTGGYNTAVGYLSLLSDTGGSFNTAIGAGALLVNTGDANQGYENTATGAAALLSNTTGIDNTANGVFALFSNTTGNANTAIGAGGLFSNIAGSFNTAIGLSALYSNIGGFNNTAIGLGALAANTGGGNNTATGYQALRSNTTGDGNTAIGRNALSLATGNGNTALGANAGNALTTGDNNIDIGADVIGVAGEADTIRIGNPNITTTYIRGISGATATGGAAVFVAANGQLGTMTSSARFKDDVKPMNNASEALFLLKPVSFRYKKAIDPRGIQQFGLIAEDVEKLNPDLVARDAEGKAYTVRYEAVNAMLLNEFLKEHKTVQEQGAIISKLRSTAAKQDAIIAQQQKEMDAVTARLNEQAAQIQRVNARLNLRKPTTQTIVDNH